MRIGIVHEASSLRFFLWTGLNPGLGAARKGVLSSHPPDYQPAVVDAAELEVLPACGWLNAAIASCGVPDESEARLLASGKSADDRAGIVDSCRETSKITCWNARQEFGAIGGCPNDGMRAVGSDHRSIFAHCTCGCTTNPATTHAVTGLFACHCGGSAVSATVTTLISFKKTTVMSFGAPTLDLRGASH
jgi:hypothetical protein